MIKGLLIKRIFNWVITLLLIAAFFGSIYFYILASSNVDTLGAGIALAKDVLSQNGVFDTVLIALGNMDSLATIQIITFLVTVAALLFLLWFVFRLYLVAERNSFLDPLTRLYNRRAILLGLKKEIEQAKRFDQPLTVAILDIDFFKRYNDAHGHQEGDRALKRVAKVIKNSIRKMDIAGRIGGEEFLLIFPKTKRFKAKIVCERIRKDIEEGRFHFEKQLPKHQLTASIGMAEFHESKSKHHAEIIEYADRQLYIAKMAGRNTIR